MHPPVDPAAQQSARSKADLHIHTLASDGTAGIAAILRHVEVATDLAVIAITDHDRIDAARVAAVIAADEGLRFAVIVGEEVTSRGGHILALFLESYQPIAPWRSVRDTVAAIHDVGGLAVPAHPLAPSPSCVPGFVLRRLLANVDPRLRPDALETFNPTPYGWAGGRRPARFAVRHGLAQIGASDAHALDAIGAGWTSFPGVSAQDLQAAIVARTTTAHGSFHPAGLQLNIFGQQLQKGGRDLRDTLAGRLRRDGSSRDLGYPET